MKSKKGFTLTELLVVILIVGVLLSMSTVAAIRHLNKTKNKSSIATAKSYITAVNDYNLISKNEKEDLIVSSNVSSINPMLNESLSGQKPKSGYVLVENNKAAYAMLCIDGKTVKYEDKKFSVIDDNCKSSKNLTDLPDIPHSTTEDKTYVCKRATTLHRETCDRTETNLYCRAAGYAQGSTIEYGNLGTTGSLATGDAFDCDVNGDGTYDSSTERFYYVTDMNNDIALLIFYNNVNKGVPDKMARSAFHSNSNNSYYGPETAMLELPTTEQWNNISLSSSIRNIVDDSGTVRVNGFSYEGYAARLLTYQEVNNGCYDGIIKISSNNGLSSKCKFLFENSEFSSSSLNSSTVYLETQPDYRTDVAWALYAGNIRLSGANVDASGKSGVRPVIEVPKVDMEI